MHFLNIFHASCRSHPYTLFTKSMIFHISYYFYLLQDEPCIFRLHMIALIQWSKSHVFSSAQTGITMNSKEVPHVRNSFKTYV